MVAIGVRPHCLTSGTDSCLTDTTCLEQPICGPVGACDVALSPGDRAEGVALGCRAQDRTVAPHHKSTCPIHCSRLDKHSESASLATKSHQQAGPRKAPLGNSLTKASLRGKGRVFALWTIADKVLMRYTDFDAIVNHQGIHRTRPRTRPSAPLE